MTMVSRPDDPLFDVPQGYQGPVTYGDYLKVPELLRLQTPLSDPPHHDEMLFIIIHQAYELWFKLVLHELERAIFFIEQDNVLRANHFVRRVVRILRLLVEQIHILETMTPAEFLQFRDRLNPASGFQSVQYREIEFLAGLRDERYLKVFQHQPELEARLRARMEGPSLRDSYYRMLRNLQLDTGSKPPPPDPEAPGDLQERQEVMAALIAVYEDPDSNLPLYLLSESLVEFDEYLALWRQHHVLVVERSIGSKRGTGGSAGVSYLRSLVGKQCFPYLWEARTYLQKR
ncbi:MAG: tryptophan 2,3-dioxygenase [Armatimonadetes bacterium]|nr:tryptophan 2,3-dioxygenase [Armatimonadota bacterium]